MGIFSKASLKLSQFFAGAPKEEVERVNDALTDIAVKQGTRPDLIVTDEVQYRPNRKARRSYSRSFRNRTRVTGISQRDDKRTPRSLHADANNKGLHFINHGLLHSLYGKAGIFKEQA